MKQQNTSASTLKEKKKEQNSCLTHSKMSLFVFVLYHCCNASVFHEWRSLSESNKVVVVSWSERKHEFPQILTENEFAQNGFDIKNRTPYFIYQNNQKKILCTWCSLHSVVVIKSAKHAEGPQFNPGWKQGMNYSFFYIIFLCFLKRNFHGTCRIILLQMDLAMWTIPQTVS